MSWADYKPPSAEVTIGIDPATNEPIIGIVRGLNLDDLSYLISNHLEPISQAVELYAKSKQNVYSTKNLHGFVISCASQFPGLVSEVISRAADEPSLREKKLAMSVQLAALNEIVRLTVEELGGLGNLSLVLGNLAKGVLENKALREPANEAGTTSPDSIGAAGKK